MEDDSLDLLLKHPTMFRENSDENLAVYKGTIHVNDTDYRISVRNADKTDFKVTLPRELTNFQAEIDSVIARKDIKNIVTVLDATCSFIGGKMPSTKLTDYSEVYRHVLYEYTDFTRFYLNIKSCFLAHDLSKIHISTLDEGRREHSFEISVNFSDKDLFKVTVFDLPLDQEKLCKSSSLKDIYDELLATIETFQPFFDVMDELDRNCWVLDPGEPKRSCNYRRIWIQENFSIIITVDPVYVFRLPEIKFLGPEKLADGFSNTLNSNLPEWNPENGIFPEILKLLGLENFPQKLKVEDCSTDLLVNNGDCSICFSARLNDKLPEVVCKNKVCENYYHAECLYEWLMAVNARKCFSEVVGLCPNCEKNITCPIPK